MVDETMEKTSFIIFSGILVLLVTSATLATFFYLKVGPFEDEASAAAALGSNGTTTSNLWRRPEEFTTLVPLSKKSIRLLCRDRKEKKTLTLLCKSVSMFFYD